MFKFLKKIIRRFRPLSPYALLEQKLVDLKDTDLRNAAEHAYALAMINKQKGDTVKAIAFGREAIALLDRCKLRTEWDSTCRNASIGGVTLPPTIGKDVVREHLKPLSLAIPMNDESPEE